MPTFPIKHKLDAHAHVHLIEMHPEFFRLNNVAGDRGAWATPTELYEWGKSLQKLAVKRGYTTEVKDTPTPKSTTPRFINLSPQARKLYQHMVRAGDISAREAMADYGITSATLSRRVCDMEDAGFTIVRTKKTHPITGKLYTRYAVAA